MCTTVATALVATMAALSPTFAQALVATEAKPEASAKFAAFVQEHGRRYEAGSGEYAARYAHFQARLAEVEAHNSKTDRTWTAAVNTLADQTPEELAMLRGYRRSSGRGAGKRSMALLGTSMHSVNVSHLPVSFSWGGMLEATKINNVKDQGACGSCWAISSAAVLRAHAELYQQDRTFSTQQIVECTPNPQECGGQGGCKGATAELAMEYVTTQGLLTEEEHAYKAADRACPANLQVPSESGTAKHDSFLSVAVRKGHENSNGGLKFGMSGWQKLPENIAEPLLLAVYEKGPVVVSVAATDGWSMYSKGVMSACQEGAVINHAVVLIGYGEGFWQIQNSWGPAWGEAGTIRLLRHDGQNENKYCGWDTNPADGTGCKGGPDKAWVCGSCGVLYDSVVPNFALSETGFLSRNKRDHTGIFTQINAASSA